MEVGYWGKIVAWEKIEQVSVDYEQESHPVASGKLSWLIPAFPSPALEV